MSYGMAKGEGGRWNMGEVPGTEKTYEADYVFLGAAPHIHTRARTHVC